MATITGTPRDAAGRPLLIGTDGNGRPTAPYSAILYTNIPEGVGIEVAGDVRLGIPIDLNTVSDGAYSLAGLPDNYPDLQGKVVVKHGRGQGAPKVYDSGWFDITSGTIDVDSVPKVASPVAIDTSAELIAEMTTLRNETQAAADAAVAPTDAQVASIIPASSGSATSAALSETIEPVRVAPFRAAGAVTISWDDAWASWHEHLLPRLRDTYRTQRHTFCLTPGQLDTTAAYMTTAQFMELHNTLPHCEVASHSQTHASMSGSTIPVRVAEYEDSKANIEALTGEPCTTFVYPFGTTGSNDTTHAELWGRYDRIVNAGIQPGGSITPMDQRLGMFLTPRPIDWNSTSHQRMLQLVRMAAHQPIIANIYSHKPGQDMTLAELDELLTLCDTLGVPVINLRDAYPGGGLIPNAFAEGSNGWGKVGVGTFDVVADTMQAGIPGSASFHLNVAATTDFVYATHTAFAVEGQHFTFSGRARKTYSATQVPNYTRLRMVPLDKTGGSLTAPIESANAGDAWGQIKAEGVMPAKTAMVRLDLIQLGAAGDSWFSHLHFGPTRWGVMG